MSFTAFRRASGCGNACNNPVPVGLSVFVCRNAHNLRSAITIYPKQFAGDHCLHGAFLEKPRQHLLDVLVAGVLATVRLWGQGET